MKSTIFVKYLKKNTKQSASAFIRLKENIYASPIRVLATNVVTSELISLTVSKPFYYSKGMIVAEEVNMVVAQSALR